MISTPSDGMTSGSINLKTGSPLQFGNGVGGEFSVSTGSGGPLPLTVESSSLLKGGDVTMKAGSTIASNDGGDFLIASGLSSNGVGGHAQLYAGSSESGRGGSLIVASGASNEADARDMSISACSSKGKAGGSVIIEPGSGHTHACFNLMRCKWCRGFYSMGMNPVGCRCLAPPGWWVAVPTHGKPGDHQL
jgi:hypothetical protein